MRTDDDAPVSISALRRAHSRAAAAPPNRSRPNSAASSVFA
jgi:hypothetical protein